MVKKTAKNRIKIRTQKKRKLTLFFSFFVVLLLLTGLIGFSYETREVQNSKSSASSPPIVNCDIAASKIAQDSEEQAFLGLINTYRQQNNVGTLKFSPALNRAAAWMALDMANHASLNHTDSLNRDPGLRVTNCGYTFTVTGENIAEGSQSIEATAQQVFSAWKASPPHNTNMLDGRFKVIGVARDFNNDVYWATDFGDFDDSGTNSLTPTPTTIPNPTPSTVFPTVAGNATIINFTLLLDGIGNAGDNTNPNGKGNFSPHMLQRIINVEFYNPGGTLTSTGQFFANFTTSKGNFSGVLSSHTLSNGTYTIKVKTDRYLRKAFPGQITIMQGQENNPASVTLTAGDINGDNILDIRDYNILMGCYSDIAPATACDTQNNVMSDLNDDQAVNQFDYNLFLREIGTKNGD